MSLRPRLPNFIGRIYFAAVLAPGRLRAGWRRLKPGTRDVLLWLAAFGAFVVPFLFLTGCHPVPSQVRIASTATVHRPLDAAVQRTNAAAKSADVAARSNATAVELVAAAVKTGLSAGSPQASNLLAVVQQTAAALADASLQYAQAKIALSQTLAALAEVDRDNAAKQKQIDQLAAVAAKVPALEADLSWYRWRFWTLVVLAALAAVGVTALVVARLLARFTGWGARTVGPLLAKAAPLLAFA